MYRDKIPSEVLALENVNNLVKVLDDLQIYKTSVLNNALRINNLKITTDKNWLLKQLDEVGISSCDSSIRLTHLIQLLANADDIQAHSGCILGIQKLVQALTFGNIIATSVGTDFHLYPPVILLNDLFVGYVVNSTDCPQLGLVDSSDDLFTNETLSITVQSYLWHSNNATITEKRAIDKALKVLIRKLLPFTNNLTLIVNYVGVETKYSNQLNKYFI